MEWISRRAKIFLIFIVCVWSCISNAVTPEEKGYQIAKEVDNRDMGFKDSSAHMVMILKNRQGEETQRKLRVKTLEVVQDGDKSLIIFDSPPDVKSTALLTYSHKVQNDDQWLYLPALKRVKRISSANQSGPFMGSEFAYEDFTSQEVEKYNYKYIKNEACGKKDCFILERIPKNKSSGYSRQTVWIDSDEYRVWRVEYYDKKNAHLKTLKMDNYKKYLNKFWRAHTMHMQNHQTKKSTTLKWKNFKFQAGLNDSDFTQASLKRAH